MDRSRLFYSLAVDITELKAAERRQTLLMREVDHRAKNALAVVQAVVRLTRAVDSADLVEAIEGRVAALARAHGLLAKGRWTGADLRALAVEELAPYLGADADRASVSGPVVALGPDAVQPTAMVLHELATNAAKHGALSRPGGRVEVCWAGADEGGLRLDWREVGGPAVMGPPTGRGFGSEMVVAAAAQLGGVATFTWDTTGLRCTLTIAPDNLGSTGRATVRAGTVAGDATGDLEGRRVLVAEDDALLSMAMRRILEDLGCTVIGPASSLGEALRLAADTPDLDAAVLDVNLRGQEVWPAAELLAVRGVPRLFTTGYGQGVEDRGAPVLEKPFPPDRLAAALRTIMAPSGDR
jgi:two-component sensor histidine kinase/CheY-like chemotaxis protein